MSNVKYQTVNLLLDKDAPSIDIDKKIFDGEVTHIATVTSGQDGEIIDLEILQNNSRILEPSDVRFSEKTASGNFVDSMRPVSGIDGGTELTFRLTGANTTRANDVRVQVLLLVQPKGQF